MGRTLLDKIWDAHTVRTEDGSPTAQWEIQLAVTEDGYELLSW